jgi:hypothetical protein
VNKPEIVGRVERREGSAFRVLIGEAPARSGKPVYATGAEADRLLRLSLFGPAGTLAERMPDELTAAERAEAGIAEQVPFSPRAVANSKHPMNMTDVEMTASLIADGSLPKGSRPTVARTSLAARVAPVAAPVVSATVEPPMTGAQASYLSGLLSQLAVLAPEVYAVAGPWVTAREETMSKRVASDVIGRLKAQTETARANPVASAPVSANALAPAAFASAYVTKAQVKPGRYALVSDEGIKFYRVRESKAGNLYVCIVAGSEEHYVKGGSAILNAIAADSEAGPRWGQQIGSCFVCGRQLTDDDSRAKGIGPTCAGR